MAAKEFPPISTHDDVPIKIGQTLYCVESSYKEIALRPCKVLDVTLGRPREVLFKDDRWEWRWSPSEKTDSAFFAEFENAVKHLSKVVEKRDEEDIKEQTEIIQECKQEIDKAMKRLKSKHLEKKLRQTELKGAKLGKIVFKF